MAVLAQEFTVKIFVLQNPFTEEKFNLALQHLLVERQLHSIIIDGQKPCAYLRQLKKALRASGVRVRNIRAGNDKAFPGLRLADLFAGLVRAYVESPGKPEAKELYALAKNKITIHMVDGQVPTSPL